MSPFSDLNDSHSVAMVNPISILLYYFMIIKLIQLIYLIVTNLILNRHSLYTTKTLIKLNTVDQLRLRWINLNTNSIYIARHWHSRNINVRHLQLHIPMSLLWPSLTFVFSFPFSFLYTNSLSLSLNNQVK